MNELQALREFREPSSEPADLTAVRAGLLRTTRSANMRSRPRIPRMVWRVAVAGALAMGLVAGGAVVRHEGSSKPEVPTAAVFLERAAAAVEHQGSPTERPRDDQWVYIKREADALTWEESLPEEWLRFKGGRRFGLDAYGELVGYATSWSGAGLAPIPSDVWDYWSTLPRDPDGLLEQIYKEVDRSHSFWHGWRTPEGRANRAVWQIGVLLGKLVGVAPPPDLQAALYRALGRIPDVKVTENVTDQAGRKVIVVSHIGSGIRETLVLDATTYAYRGNAFEIKDGKITSGITIVETKIVDRPGEH